MTEEDWAAIIFEGDVAGGVTLGAIPFDGEGSRPVVAGATGDGFLFHRLHRRGEAWLGGIDVEEGIMAGRTVLADLFQMEVVTELNRAGRIAVDGDFVL